MERADVPATLTQVLSGVLRLAQLCSVDLQRGRVCRASSSLHWVGCPAAVGDSPLRLYLAYAAGSDRVHALGESQFLIALLGQAHSAGLVPEAPAGLKSDWQAALCGRP